MQRLRCSCVRTSCRQGRPCLHPAARQTCPVTAAMLCRMVHSADAIQVDTCVCIPKAASALSPASAARSPMRALEGASRIPLDIRSNTCGRLSMHARAWRMVLHLAKCDPVESSGGAKHGVDAATECKHGFVDGGEQCAKHNHAGGGKQVANDARDRFRGVAEKLRNSLQVANLVRGEDILCGLHVQRTRVLVSLSSSERYTGK